MEAHAVIRRTNGFNAAMEFWASLIDSPRVEVVRSDAELEREAIQVLEAYPRLALSFADAVSFAVMRRRRIELAFAFDRHFALAGFRLTPT